jgi:hypothetical protein
MGVTDTYCWLRAIVYNALIGHIKMVRIPDRRRYILPMAFRLAVGGSGRVLQ